MNSTPTPKTPTEVYILKLFVEWCSRTSATFFGCFFALLVFSLLVRFYIEMTVGKALGNLSRPAVVAPLKGTTK